LECRYGRGDDQIEHLKAVAAARGWTVAQAFIDRPMPVRKHWRPGEKALLDAIRAGDVQKVLMVGIDRVGRSLVDLVGFLEACRTADVALWLDQEGMDTEISNGLSLSMLAGCWPTISGRAAMSEFFVVRPLPGVHPSGSAVHRWRA
jgi:DNA invertase Pin-like site-specific DNA recombinase